MTDMRDDTGTGTGYQKARKLNIFQKEKKLNFSFFFFAKKCNI
jgi:hypothetical protein